MLTLNNLHDYQRACIEHIIKKPFCGVFLEMGLGKTVSTLTAIDALKFDYCEITSVLVIAPKRVAESVWAEEAQQWEHLKHLTFSKIIGSPNKRITALKTKADIHIISRDNIAWLCSYCGGARLPWDMIVIDELSSFKSHKAVRFKALKAVRPTVHRLVGLTGTPAPNSLIDLWPQMYLIDRGERLEKTITKYRELYFRPGMAVGNVVYKYKPFESSEQIIHDKIKDICISMKAEDYLKLPDKIDNYIRLKMPEPLKKSYEKFEKEKVLELIAAEGTYGSGQEKPVEISVMNAVALTNKLLQFANGAIYDENHAVHEVHDLKIEALRELIENANGKPILVGWTFRFDKDRIMHEFEKEKPRELKTAKDIEDWNAGKIKLMLAHPASAGHGLNLQAGGSIIVWFGQTWSLELYQQFNARLHRQGQANTVIIHHLIVDGTEDETVISALRNKSNTQNALMDSLKAKISKYKLMAVKKH